jgi:hypothetical protein
MAHKYPERERKAALDYYYKNRERIAKKSKKRYEERCESDPGYRALLAARTREHQKKHRNDPRYKERQKAKLAELELKYGHKRGADYKQNPDSVRRARKNYGHRLKNKIFSTLGERCVCCGETIVEFLTVDHINGGGAAHRKALGGRRGWTVYADIVRQGVPKDKFRILCMNCNWATRKGDECPHKAAK